MADPKAFVSFDFDHNETEKNLFVGHSKNSSTPFFIQDWSAKSLMPQFQWEEIVKNKINYCNMLIVLSGQSMASATGVAKEISMAKNQDVPIFGVYIDGANTSSNLPNGLARNRTIACNWDSIADAINQMMSEGKNKVIVSSTSR
jgi:Thoeris protein ThsB, TIR-like domain